MSSLQALSGFKLEIDLVQKILKDYTTLTNSGKSIVLCWVLLFITKGLAVMNL